MRVVVLPVVAIATVLTGCGSTTADIEPSSSLPTAEPTASMIPQDNAVVQDPAAPTSTTALVAEDLNAIVEGQIDNRPFLEALVGSWESPACNREFPDCAIWTFESDGTFTYDYTTDDYSDSHSTRWSAQAVADGVGRVAFEDAGIHIVLIEDELLSIPGEGSGFVKIKPGTSVEDLAPVDPGQLQRDVVGAWVRPDGAAIESTAHPDRMMLHSSGAFEATYGDATCTGLWTFGVAGDIGRNAGDPDEGNLILQSGELCNNRDSYQDRTAWDHINRLSLTTRDGTLFFDGLEYRGSPSSDLHFFTENLSPVHARIAEPVVAGEPALLLIEIDQPMQYGRLADEVHSITVYSSGSTMHAPDEEIIGDGTQLEISEPIEAVPGEVIRFALPIVFADANQSVDVQISFEMLLEGERAIQTSPSARLNFEVAN